MEPLINNIRPVIFSIYHDLPRGLVVRIRRSHRRGPGSIPGVGIVSCFGKSNFIRLVGSSIRLGFVNMWTLLDLRSRENVHLVIFVDQILAQLHAYQLTEVSQCSENLKQDFKMYVQRLSIV